MFAGFHQGFGERFGNRDEVYQDKSGHYRFRLKATNGEIIAVSEGYSSMASCMNGIESLKKNAPTATVFEVKEQGLIYIVTGIDLNLILSSLLLYFHADFTRVQRFLAERRPSFPFLFRK